MTSRVIVIGASMAGLLAARVLSEHADEVIVLERDTPAGDGMWRRGVPQGRHAHALLAAGERLIEGWFPGIVDELVAAGAVRSDAGNGFWWQAGALKVRAEVGIQATCMSRPALEDQVRRRTAMLPNVSLRQGVKVDSLIVEGGEVRGIDAQGERIRADLVVDCSGRDTRTLLALEAAGFEPPPISLVRANITYSTRILSRRSDDLDGMYAIVAPTPPFENRVGVLLPIEGDRWILTLGGYHGDAAPTDDDGFLAFAESLPAPVIARVLANAETVSPVMTHRFAASRRRHFERLRSVPGGFVALGDAICSFNPIYGQGMSSAALQADELATVVTRHGVGRHQIARAFYRRAAKVVDGPWKIAVGSDFLHPQTTGPKPSGTDLINRYVGLVQRATHVSPGVLSQMQRVQNLLAPPQSLMAPATLARVLATFRRSPATMSIDTTSAVVESAV